jgi:ribonuclease HII
MNLETEQAYFSKGIGLLGAIDEAGRGPLAGPVVAACVLIGPDFKITEDLSAVKDSKKLSETKREELYDIIIGKVKEAGIGLCGPDTIDRINILQAAFLAMKMALGQLKQKPDYLLLDGRFPLPNYTAGQEAIIKGDQKVFSIAAASIIAKVARDRIMREQDKKYPQYGFVRHKGYGTAFHLAALKAYGPSPIHRKTFARVKTC